MADGTKITELWAQLEAAHSRAGTQPATRAPTPGDVYTWAPPNDLGLDWVVVSTHPDDPARVFVVPADGQDVAGLADVVVRATGCEPLSLRCGRGVWLRTSDLPAERWYRALDDHHTHRAQEKVRQIAAGTLDGSSAAWEDEVNPDYDAWMMEVTRAVLGATARNRSPITLVERDFGPWRTRLQQERAAEVPLAAATHDPFAELLAPPVVSTSPLPFSGSGDLRVVRSATGATVVFETDVPTDPPPLSVVDAAGTWTQLVWECDPDRTHARATALWGAGQVHLRVGSGDSAWEVIVPKPANS
jgi:hypothetical protein